ncbi:natural killer cell receptor 2B4-like [Chanos chanos]|uniref:Natural killer cell receptor 2B4-like n=1 Tax=Chanos chanos TaxID=29144 RepID=A0A6J2WDZ1_CHACN|nr:natural killer cell receptor 2B4-like [Chanos chanos]
MPGYTDAASQTAGELEPQISKELKSESALNWLKTGQFYSVSAKRRATVGKTVVLGVNVDRVKTVREGETVTLHTGFTGLQSDVHMLWAYGPVDPKTKIVQSQILRGEIITDYSDRFRDRLQLDRQTGSLTIRNISTTDSGVYKVQIINGEISYKTFSFTVYATVPAPHIRVRQSRSAGSGSSGPKCSVVCSVENGRDVTLSWYKGKEILNQTSSPDLNTILSLPLEIEVQDNNTYSCVAANPVSHQATQLSKELCPYSPGN